MNSREGLERLLDRRGILDAAPRTQMLRFLLLLEKWNARLDLTSSTSWRLAGPLFGEAIWAAGFVPESVHSQLDIGSGAGFPAIPMKILIPRVRLTLLEGRVKRATFLETVVRELSLQGTEVRNRRLAEHLVEESAETRWDLVSWKGLRLGKGELEALAARVAGSGRLWMFHGRERAVSAPEALERWFRLRRREHFPGKRSWQLSIYARR